MNSTPAVQATSVPVVADGRASNVIDEAGADLTTQVIATSVTVEDMCLAAVEIQTRLLKGCKSVKG